MGRACTTYGGEKRCTQDFSGGNLRERVHLEDLGIDGKIILKYILKKWDGAMDWIDLAQDRDRWWALVKVVMNFQVT